MEDGTLSMYEQGIEGKVSTNRQDLPVCYFLAHNFWVLNVEFLCSGRDGQQPWGFMGDKILPYVIDESIDIHHEIDLYITAYTGKYMPEYWWASGVVPYLNVVYELYNKKHSL